MHKEPYFVEKPDDFDKLSIRKCKKECDYQKDCGHICKE